MIANQNALIAIKGKYPEYKELRSPGNEGSIYYKVLKAGQGTDSIYFTSIVSCYYKGWYIADYPEYNITSGDKFRQQLFDDGPPVSFTVKDSYISSTGWTITAGWKTALQHMVKGDKWEIWEPYQLGHGRNDYTIASSLKIPGYSTLVYELEVTNVIGVY
jgi:peptidylprolyl isomerase/FKBP-type peptidyl-prolyl cis-trans isomerase FklB